MTDVESVIESLRSPSLRGGAGRDITSAYKVTATRVLGELQRTLGHELEDKEVFMFVHGTAEVKLQPGSGASGKCRERSEEARRRAEADLEEGNMERSLELANRAVMAAPTEENAGMELLALALFLRSRILLGLGHPQLAVRDAGLAAIKGGFPEPRLFSLYAHQAKCHEAIKCAFEAQKCYNRAISALEKSDLDQSSKDAEKSSMMEALSSLMRSQTGRPQARPAPASKCEAGLEIRARHPKYPALSRLVTLTYSREKGRHARARDEIRPDQYFATS